MNVTSVKNLNGESFSAVQDAALTDFVSSNSASWTGGGAGVSGTNVVFVPQYEGADYGYYYSARISGDVVVTTGNYFGDTIYPTTTGFSLSSVGASIGNKLDKDKIEASKTIKIINDHAEVTDKAYRQTGFIDISAHNVNAGGSTVNVDFVSYDADNDSCLYSAIVTVETTASGSYIPNGWSLVSYENNSATFTKYYSLNERTDTFYISTYYGEWGAFTNAEGSATVYSALEIAPLAFKDEIPSTANFYTNDNPSGFITGVPAGTMNESSFAYDASNNITAYNGSAFKAGDEFPQSATEAIETVTSSSATWNDTTDTVTANSGAWGGSALPISAGPGIKLEMVDNTLVASTSGYVWQSASLFYTATPVKNTTYTLTDSCSNYDKLEVDFYDINNYRTMMECLIPPNLDASGTRGGYFSVVSNNTGTASPIWFKCFNWNAAGTTWTCYCSEIAAQGGSTTQTVNANQPDNPPKVIQIIGWKRVGGN